MRADRLEQEIAALKIKVEMDKIKETPSAIKIKKLEKELASKSRKTVANLVRDYTPKIKAMLRQANSIDMALVMDCTGSMASWMSAAQRSLIEIVKIVQDSSGGASVRVAFVGYRDHCDRGNPPDSSNLFVHDFTEDASLVTESIKSQSPTGGGDGPEDIPGGFEATLGLRWQSEAKLVFVVADAHCHENHGTKFGDMDDDATSKRYMGRDPNILKQMEQFASRGMDFHFIECNDSTSHMIRLLRAAYTSAKPLDGIPRKFETSMLSSGGEAGIASTLVSTLSSRARDSLLCSRARSSMKLSDVVWGPERFDPTSRLPEIAEGSDSPGGASLHSRAAPMESPLNWDAIDRLKWQHAKRHTFHTLPDEDIDWVKPKMRHAITETRVKISQHPFSHGAMRCAHGFLDENLPGCRMVAKRYFAITPKEADLQRDIEAQAVAKILSHEFSSCPGLPRAVDFISTCYYELTDVSDPAQRLVAVEPFITGDYKKYNSNSAWVGVEEFGEVAQAFSHFTYDYTGANIMVVDLQGASIAHTYCVNFYFIRVAFKVSTSS
jgi:vacuole morphology and inheritance protein 14